MFEVKNTVNHNSHYWEMLQTIYFQLQNHYSCTWLKFREKEKRENKTVDPYKTPVV